MDYRWTTVATGKEKVGSATADRIEPYADWEQMTRPAWRKGVVGGKALALWQPVLAELNPGHVGGIRAAAGVLLSLIDPLSLAIGADVQAMLRAVATTGVQDKLDAHFFLFRPETDAHQPLMDGRDALYRVLHVGPAVPGAFIDPTATGPASVDGAERAGAIGTTVLTATVDDVTGIAHERFRLGRTATRIARFWAQAQPDFSTGGPARPAIGTQIDAARINGLLQSQPSEDDLYRELYPRGLPFIAAAPRSAGAGLRSAADIADPAHHRPFMRDSHGTHVLDLAAGEPAEDGVADRPILSVQLPRLATFETSGARLDVFVLMAVMRILDWADNWQEAGQAVRAPVVINISYGILAGPKDGSGLMEAEIARLVEARNAQGVATAVVLPAGNGFRAGCHAVMDLDPGQGDSVTLRLQPEDLTTGFVEIWLDRVERLALTLSPPAGPPVTLTLAGGAACVADWQCQRGGGAAWVTIGRVYVRPAGARLRVVLALCPTLNHDDPDLTAPPGAYGIALFNEGAAPVTAAIDVQRDDALDDYPAAGRQAYLDHPSVDAVDPETLLRDMPRPGQGPVSRLGTISAHATADADAVIVVGAAFGRDARAEAALYSGAGAGPERRWPDLAATGDESRSHPGILGAGTLSASAATYSGTSVAAPQVTRAIVDQWRAKGTIGTTPVDIGALLAGGRPLPARDTRLGAGIARTAPGRGRPIRREPD